MFTRLTINGKKMETIEDVRAEVRLRAYNPTVIVNDPADESPWNAEDFLGECEADENCVVSGNFFTFTAEEWEREQELAAV